MHVSLTFATVLPTGDGPAMTSPVPLFIQIALSATNHVIWKRARSPMKVNPFTMTA